MSALENPDWHNPLDDIFDDQWEPWPDDDEPEVRPFGCEYCGAPEVRESPEPFGQRRCCDPCFNQLIGGDRDDPPWRCGTQLRGAS